MTEEDLKEIEERIPDLRSRYKDGTSADAVSRIFGQEDARSLVEEVRRCWSGLTYGDAATVREAAQELGADHPLAAALEKVANRILGRLPPRG